MSRPHERSSTEGPVGRLASSLLRPISWIWRAVAASRNARFDGGRGVRRVPVPVISVGNISVGGTGKTPFVSWCVGALRASGRRPAIAMRGYGARGDDRSDEEREYALVVPDVPVIARPDRHAAISEHLKAHPGTVDVVVLDDGFQHRQLARDVDIVLVDAERPALESPMLPSGWLREPAEGLRRATCVVVTRAERVDERLARRIESLHGRPPMAWCRHTWFGIDVIERGEARREALSWLGGRRAFGLFGVGHPEAVRAAYVRAGATLLACARVRDHERYRRATVTAWLDRAISLGADCIATTRKDWTKLRELVPADAPPIVVPDVGLEFLAGEEALRALVLGRAPTSASP